MSLLDALYTIAGTVTAGTAIGAFVWWLIAPRVTNSVEQACTRALGPIVESHDERIARLEHVMHSAQHPTTLVELADLLDLVKRNAPREDTPP